MEHIISAVHLEVVLAAHKTSVSARWCVMSAHTLTQQCSRHASPYRIRTSSVPGPMSRGDWCRTLNRIESAGARSVRRDYGCGIRTLRAENAYLLER